MHLYGAGLSTPHGTLGTPKKAYADYNDEETFNSTRYIRNIKYAKLSSFLGINFQLHTVH